MLLVFLTIILIILSILLILDVFLFKEKIFSRIKSYITEATIMLVVVTLFLGSWQMDAITKADKAKFLLDLKQSFYYSNPNNRKIIEAIDGGWLRITSESFATEKNRPKDIFSDFEIDEYIINFDYMNIFINKAMLDEKDVNQVFGWYIRNAWNNPEIQNYIIRIRREEKDVYSNFENLANKMKKKD